MLSVPLLIEKIYRRALLPKLKEGTRLGKLARNRLTSPIVYSIIGKKVRTIFGGRMRFFGVGGAAFDSEAESFFHKIHFPYALGYGLTETSPFIAGCDAVQRTRFRELWALCLTVLMSDLILSQGRFSSRDLAS